MPVCMVDANTNLPALGVVHISSEYILPSVHVSMISKIKLLIDKKIIRIIAGHVVVTLQRYNSSIACDITTCYKLLVL